MKEKNNQNNSQKREPELRKTTISFRVTRAERKIIGSLAEKCGMQISDYVRCRAINYEPKVRLTPEQTELRNELMSARSDYVKYTSMLNSMSQPNRLILFNNQKWMTEALKRLSAAADEISRILREYFSLNRPSRGTSKQNESKNKS